MLAHFAVFSKPGLIFMSSWQLRSELSVNNIKGYHRMRGGQPIITINVPLFKKLRDIIFFWWDNHFMSHFEGHFEGAKTFLTP